MMNASSLAVVAALGRTTLLLAVAAGVVAAVLRWARPASPGVHRAAWCLVLLQGLLWLRVPIAIPYEASAVEPAAAVVDSPASGPASSDLEAAGSKAVGAGPLPAGTSVTGAKAADAILPSPGPVLPPAADRTEPAVWSSTAAGDAAPASAPAEFSSLPGWPGVVADVWLVGLAVVVGVWLAGYLGFLILILRSEPAAADWAGPWDALVAGLGRRPIPMRVSRRLGPMLGWLPWGYRLVVPAGVWQRATPAARLAILGHELAHLARGDVGKSLLARLAALPHWFNPLAWYAVRQFDEAAEWACDAAATRAGRAETAEYAKALLLLGETAVPWAVPGPAARGRGLSQRIRRIIHPRTTEDPLMKKLLVIGVALALVVACLIRLELVAGRPPAAAAGGDEAAAPAARGENAPAPAAPANQRPAIAESPQEDPDAARLMDLLRRQRDLLEQTVKAIEEEYRIGKTALESLASVYADLHRAELAVARTPAERIAAHQRYVQRLEPIVRTVEVKSKHGVVGGSLAEVNRARGELLGAQAALLRERLAAKAPAAPVAAPAAEEPSKDLRYEGRTFQQWCVEIQTELSPNRRFEAVRALAAFAAHGYGTEAARQIVAVMRQYHQSPVVDTPVGKLKQAAQYAFKPKNPRDPNEADSIDPQTALPVLLEELKSGPRNGRQFAVAALQKMGVAAKGALPALVQVVRNDTDLGVRQEAMGAIAVFDETGETMASLLVEAVRGSDPAAAAALIDAAVSHPAQLWGYTPTLFGANPANAEDRWRSRSNKLLEPVLEAANSADAKLRTSAINAMALLGSTSDKVAPVLLGLLQKTPMEDQPFFQILVALGNLGPKAKAAIPVLEQLRPTSKGRSRTEIDRLLDHLRWVGGGGGYPSSGMGAYGGMGGYPGGGGYPSSGMGAYGGMGGYPGIDRDGGMGPGLVPGAGGGASAPGSSGVGSKPPAKKDGKAPAKKPDPTAQPKPAP
jgi:beta-lactamase regulating signal transducer with metallopeptidase domain